MAKKPNNNRIEDVEQLTQLDYGGVIKDVHSFPGHYLRVRDALTVVKNHYDYLTATYNIDNQPTQVKYYVGISPHETKVSTVSDVSGSLNNKYFFIFEGRSQRKFHIWYNVNGAGTDPAPAGSTGIEVELDTNDPAAIVAYATELILNSSAYKEYFTARRAGSQLYITANKAGATNDSLDVDTTFTILNEQGTSLLVQTVDIEYDTGHPLFDGQVLYDYYYDIYSGSYRRKLTVDQVDVDLDDTTDSVSAAISGHSTRFIATVDEDYVKADLDTAAFTEVLAYTAAQNLKIRAVRVNGNTFGSYRAKVDGVIQAYFQTSITERNCIFEFFEDLHLDNGQELTIEFLPDRLQIDDYNFFMRIESYT